MTAPRAWYNDNDPKNAAWLRVLIAQGLIAPGDVDERPIQDVEPRDLRGYTQCHFFAGIGGWSYAARLAGWPDDRPLWTGSCPCQPFSGAGKRGGFTDKRHLWPFFFDCIQECVPPTIFGEQVAGPDGRAWLDLVQTNLESTDYACGAVNIPSAGFGAPNIRQRLYWVADSQRRATERHRHEMARPSRGMRTEAREQRIRVDAWHGNDIGRLADSMHAKRWPIHIDREDGCDRSDARREETCGNVGARGQVHGLAHADSDRCEPGLPAATSARHGHPTRSEGSDDRHGTPGPTNGFWRDPDWLQCRDEKWRPVEPGTFPLAHGIPARVGRLRGYGNAINAETAAHFIACYMEVRGIAPAII